MSNSKVNHYMDFFSKFPPSTLYEVYSLETEQFIMVGGTERNGHTAVNSEKVINHLSNVAVTELQSTIVIKYMRDDVNFNDPVFIGSVDGYDH